MRQVISKRTVALENGESIADTEVRGFTNRRGRPGKPPSPSLKKAATVAAFFLFTVVYDGQKPTLDARAPRGPCFALEETMGTV